MHAHEPQSPVVVHERYHSHVGIAALLLGAGAVVIALAVLLAVLWLILSTPKATGFDADGVRCFKAATEMTCIKTANP